MFFIYLGKNGCGKTHKLNKEYDEKVGENKIFFPCASEILSMIEGEENKNYQGMIGKKVGSKKYDNPMITLIKLISNKLDASSKKNIKNTIEKIEKSTNKFQKEITEELRNVLDDNDNNHNDKNKYIEFKNELINSYVHYDFPWCTKILLFDILNKKNKFSNENFSHGQLSFNNMKFCLKLIERYKLELSLFFDEPDNYLNPELINELVDLMFSIKDNCSIYISSHNPYFISHLLNKVKWEDIVLYHLEAEQSSSKRGSKCRKVNNKEQYIPPSLLIYEIYNVCTIDLLDFYIGEIRNVSIKSNEKTSNELLYKFDSDGEKDEEIIKNDDKVERVYEYFINKKDNELGYIENGKYKHYSIIHLVRNYYHHPSDRKIMMDDINKKMKEEYTNIEVLLKCAIENIRDLLEKNNCTTYKLDYEDCNN